MNDKIWDKLSTYVRSKVSSLYDPSFLMGEDSNLEKDCEILHAGFYIGMVSSRGEELVREGFMKEGLLNIKDSADTVIHNLFNELKHKNITYSQMKSSTFHLFIISDCQYISDPLSWDENKDGVYFMWGQDYRSLYLPYQIKRMNCPKVEIMDKLCISSKIPSSFWRLPEGLVWKISCSSHTC